MDYKKKYKEALERAKKWYYAPNADKMPTYANRIIKEIFPELKESDDEKIISAIRKAIEAKVENLGNGVTRTACLSWLEKQSYTKKDIDDAYLKGITDTKNEMEKQYEANYQIRKDIATFIFNYRGDIKDRAKWMDYLGIKVSFAEKQGEQNHCMIQWKGDNLKEVIDFTGKDKNFEKWFKSFEEYEKYVHEHNNIFKIFNTDGSHYEVPVGAWIVKTPDGYNIASKAIFRQKSVDTPKFKVGDWIANDYCAGKIIALTDDAYLLDSEQGIPFSCEHNAHLWTIEDAQDGDLIYVSTEEKEIQAIFHKFENGIIYFHCYLCGDFTQGGYMPIGSVELVYPLQKTHYKRFFEKMHEAGYEWNADKKELKEIKQKPAWSEEDEKIGKELMDFCIKCSQGHTIVNSQDDFSRWATWLNSLKDRHTWKPSDEQVDALNWALSLAKNCGEDCAFELRTLQEQLKKLKE